MLGLSVSNPSAVPRIMYLIRHAYVGFSVEPLHVAPGEAAQIGDADGFDSKPSLIGYQCRNAGGFVSGRDRRQRGYRRTLHRGHRGHRGEGPIVDRHRRGPAGSASGGEGGDDEHAVAPAAINAAAVALKNRFCTSPARFPATIAESPATEM